MKRRGRIGVCQTEGKANRNSRIRWSMTLKSERNEEDPRWTHSLVNVLSIFPGFPIDESADYGGADQESTPQPIKKVKSKHKNKDLDLSKDISGRSTPTSSASTISKKEVKAAKRAKRKAQRLEAEVVQPSD